MTEEQKKLRIGLVFGGRSGEHEVSIASANAVMANLDRSKYEVVPIGITREGSWLLGIEPPKLLAAEQFHTSTTVGATFMAPAGGEENTLAQITAVTLTGDPNVRRLIPVGGGPLPGEQGALDVVFPVMHGTYGEDGALQGLLEMANVPYIGCGVLGSALGMDKEKMKLVFQSVGLALGDFRVYRRTTWEHSPERVMDEIEQQLGYPNFVKPVNLGSSVGINKAHNREELEHAMRVAAEYDRKIIVEKAIICRELEVDILGNDEPLASVVGEVIPSNEFYDYNAKYLDGKSQVIIPANIPQETAEAVRRMAIQAFLALDLSGLARVDFFLEKGTGKVYINEVNTLPGFTQISMYSKLWEASGLPYPELLDRLIELAVERHEDRQRNRTSR